MGPLHQTKLPVIIMSGSLWTKSVPDFLQRPMISFLGKPFEPAQLEALLNNALNLAKHPLQIYPAFNNHLSDFSKSGGKTLCAPSANSASAVSSFSAAVHRRRRER